MGQSVKHDKVTIKVARGPPRNSRCRRSSDEACDDIQNSAVVKWGCFVVKYQRTGVKRSAVARGGAGGARAPPVFFPKK